MAADLKEIYRATTAVQAEMELNIFQAKWETKYQAIGKLWKDNWERVTPFFEISGVESAEGDLLRPMRWLDRCT